MKMMKKVILFEGAFLGKRNTNDQINIQINNEQKEDYKRFLLK